MFRSIEHHQAIFKNLEYGACSANSIHVIWDPIRLTNVKGKAIPLQAWTDPEGSRRVRLPDFKTIGT